MINKKNAWAIYVSWGIWSITAIATYLTLPPFGGHHLINSMGNPVSPYIEKMAAGISGESRCRDVKEKMLNQPYDENNVTGKIIYDVIEIKNLAAQNGCVISDVGPKNLNEMLLYAVRGFIPWAFMLALLASFIGLLKWTLASFKKCAPENA